jgi:hypothetical protein
MEKLIKIDQTKLMDEMNIILNDLSDINRKINEYENRLTDKIQTIKSNNEDKYRIEKTIKN